MTNDPREMAEKVQQKMEAGRNPVEAVNEALGGGPGDTPASAGEQAQEGIAQAIRPAQEAGNAPGALADTAQMLTTRLGKALFGGGRENARESKEKEEKI